MPKYHWFAFLLECLSGSCFLYFVFGGCRCGNQGGIGCGARLEQKAALGREFIDNAKNLLG